MPLLREFRLCAMPVEERSASGMVDLFHGLLLNGDFKDRMFAMHPKSQGTQISQLHPYYRGCNRRQECQSQSASGKSVPCVQNGIVCGKRSDWLGNLRYRTKSKSHLVAQAKGPGQRGSSPQSGSDENAASSRSS